MLSGSVQTTKYKYTTSSGSAYYWWAVLNWTATQDITNNQTKINWELLANTDSATLAVRYSELRVKIDGSEVYYVDETNNISGYQGTKLASGSTTVSHNLDGSKSIAISVEAGIYVHAIYCSGSGTFELDQIPRASTISATDANVGAVSMIAVNRKSDSYTHSIKYTFGSLSGYVTADGVSSSEAKLSQTSIGFTIPDTFYAQMSGAKTKTCTLTCTTYSGSTKIGDVATTQFTVTAAQDASAPTVSGTIVDVNSVSKVLTGNANKLIRFVSTARCTITATAKNSATISEKKINGQTVSGTTLDIEKVEFGTIPFYAKDSRGYETTVDVTAEIVPYVVLTCNPRIVRTDQAAGKAKIYINGNYYSGSFGSKSNSLTVKVSYKSGSSTVNVSVSPTIGSDGEYSVEKEISGLNYDSTYTFTVTVSDQVSSIEKTVPLGRGIPVFDWGQNDFYFNVPVYMDGNLLKGLGTPVDNDDAIPLGYAKRNISVTSNKILAVGDTFTVSESIIDKNPVIAILSYGQTFGRVSGSTGNKTVIFHSVTNASSGVYINFATFSVTDDGLTLTLTATKRFLLTSSGMTVETDVSLHFGEVILIA